MRRYARVEIAVVLIVIGGFAVGLIVGRWWALLAALGFGVWAWSVSELEVPDWFIGLLYGLTAALGISLGVTARRYGRRFLGRF